jgi:accessory colonization factor AcfC
VRRKEKMANTCALFVRKKGINCKKGNPEDIAAMMAVR